MERIADAAEMEQPYDPPRRPLATRSKAWAKALARRLTSAGVSPNAISLSGLAFGLGAGVALAASGRVEGLPHVASLLAAGALIQLRLLCNMLDGMVAIEGGRRTKSGELFNDMPDRFADIAILVGAGYSLHALPWGPALGFVAAILAVLTAYVRLLGASMGTPQFFLGPMAKPHRMATMTAACVLGAVAPLAGFRFDFIALALAIVAAGSCVTFARRTARIVALVESR